MSSFSFAAIFFLMDCTEEIFLVISNKNFMSQELTGGSLLKLFSLKEVG